MKMWERRWIDKKVRVFVLTMPKDYKINTPKDQIISEILAANDWFINISKPMEIIREEVEKQFNIYVR
ncbi:hypothetical protein [Enterococcus gilvus]|uniref:Uncharacterized protein n=1 Tax=Enterococcus gilvus ATCC BAA-350 TaxID=1158614 RepID=R2XIV2_9ENTE|nr:hypothetical protein [Enterococcus gilvus]EOI54829.1 hypothetical protein UKC_02866 [Enterococcus gilvus ATCC BAA-350]EOW81795.1 hypothetical protein I592_01095 [Enterococcus gilvus ATCC BAA-350]